MPCRARGRAPEQALRQHARPRRRRPGRVERGAAVALLRPQRRRQDDADARSARRCCVRAAARVVACSASSAASHGAAVRRRIAVLGHESWLYPDLSPRENLRFYARLFGVDRSAGARRCADRPPRPRRLVASPGRRAVARPPATLRAGARAACTSPSCSSSTSPSPDSTSTRATCSATSCATRTGAAQR